MTSQKKPDLGNCTSLYEGREIMFLPSGIREGIVGREKKEKNNKVKIYPLRAE